MNGKGFAAPSPPHSGERGSAIERVPVLLAAFATLALIAANLWFVDGARGVDQLWYLADTERLANGGEPRTNTVFAGIQLRADERLDDSAILHNGPLLHLYARAARHIGAFETWRIGNLVLHLLTALLVGVSVERLCGRAFAWLAYSAQLLAPIAVWQSANLFQDTFYAFLAAVLLWACIHRRTRPALQWIAVGAIALGGASHPAFLCLGLVFGFLAMRRPSEDGVALFAFVAVAGAVAVRDLWFPSSFQPGLIEIIGSSLPGGSNMYWQLSESTMAVTPALLVGKLIEAIRLQLFHLQFLPSTLPTNVGLVTIAVLLYRAARAPGRRLPSWLVMSAAMFGLHLAILVLMENQPRYQVTVLPAALLCSSVFWHRWRPSPAVLASFSLLALPVLAFDVLLLERVQRTYRIQQEIRAEGMALLGHLPVDARLAFVGHRAADQYVPLVTSFAPRAALLLDTHLLDDEATDRALALFAPDIVVADDTHDGDGREIGNLGARGPLREQVVRLSRRP